ncbi:MAG TPA: 16S rRNA (cytidine(1402)-2'-O)-methyltransferase [Firmicutes bacterium]|nr:16S rRNA (cytidine(1402)-2'-O)-methyltransferase [Bacillota bacterium]
MLKEDRCSIRDDVSGAGDEAGDTGKGLLYVCGTPIGNLKDVSFRLLEVLNQVDLIICEDTRRTMKLLSHYGIKKRLVAFHEHIEKERTGFVLDELSKGKTVAMVSDAGMPLISDPGAYLIRAAREHGLEVVSVPGPSAVTTALALSGFYSSQFIFAGFPPRKPGKRQDFFTQWIRPDVPVVFFESPYRLLKCLGDLIKVFPTIQVSLCHEMTKIHESVIIGPAQDVYEQMKDRRIQGEWVIVAYLQSQLNSEEAG